LIVNRSRLQLPASLLVRDPHELGVGAKLINVIVGRILNNDPIGGWKTSVATMRMVVQ